MGIIVDLVVIVIIALSTFLAYHKGLVKLAIGLCAFIISLVISFVLYQPISNLVIQTTGIDEAIEDTIYKKVNDVMKENTKEDGLTGELIESAKDEMLPQTARNLAINIVKGGVMIVLFIAVRIAIRFITIFVDAIAKLPIIHQLNKTGGILYGILRGILIVYVAFFILKIPGQIDPNNTINESINQSFIGKTMYENNIWNVFF